MRLPSPNGRWTALLSPDAGSLALIDAQGVIQSIFPAGSTVTGAQWTLDGRRLAVTLNHLPQGWQMGDQVTLPPEIHFLDFEEDTFVKAESLGNLDMNLAERAIKPPPGSLPPRC